MSKQEVVIKNPVVRFAVFLQEAWEELKKVHVPNKQETIQATIAVLVMATLVAVFLGLADLLIGKIMQAVLL